MKDKELKLDQMEDTHQVDQGKGMSRGKGSGEGEVLLVPFEFDFACTILYVCGMYVGFMSRYVVCNM